MRRYQSWQTVVQIGFLQIGFSPRFAVGGGIFFDFQLPVNLWAHPKAQKSFYPHPRNYRHLVWFSCQTRRYNYSVEPAGSNQGPRCPRLLPSWWVLGWECYPSASLLPYLPCWITYGKDERAELNTGVATKQSIIMFNCWVLIVVGRALPLVFRVWRAGCTQQYALTGMFMYNQ